MEGPPSLKRPKSTDNEEELFRMQEEFLQNKQQPSAKVINLRGSTNSSFTASNYGQASSGKIRSKFAERRSKAQDKICPTQSSGDVINPAIKDKVEKKLLDSVQNIPTAPSRIIFGNIIEKKYDSSNYKFNKKELSFHSNTGFPEVFVSTNLKNDNKQSLFLQQILSESCSTSKEEAPQNSGAECADDGSVIIEGSWANEIHKENLERLNQMSQEDILKEKSQLEKILKPELIQFLKDRRNKKDTVKKSPKKLEAVDVESQDENVKSIKKQELSIEEIPNKHDADSVEDDNITPMEVDKLELQDVPNPSVELMEQAKKKGWVHMDFLEPEKLKWMEDIPTEKKDEPAPDEPYNARFNFDGVLLAYRDETVPIEKGLHHHGEEPERPGYSLQELLQLSRSSTQQQRCTALTTLANIIEKSRQGWYDKVLQPAPLTALSQRNLLLLLRFSLDDTSIAVVTATLQALRAFLYSEADEVCLDRLYGFQNYEEPVLSTPKTDVDDISSLEDHQLAQLDVIAALLRTDILLRIRYILSEMRPPPVGVTCALEILIRITRHSPITVLKIVNTPNLLDTIIEHFMPLSTDPLAMVDLINNVYGVPVLAAVRLCRILVCYGGKSVANTLNSCKIVQRIMSYISCDAGKASFNLSIESLRLWRTLLLYDEATDSLTGAQLILVSQLQLLLSNHDIQNASELACEYAAALIAVASCLAPLKENISVLLSKWSTQLMSLDDVTWGKSKLIAETLLAVSNSSTIKTLNISRTMVFSKLRSISNLLSDCGLATEREPSSLPHLGALMQEGQLQPIVSQNSCMPFLSTVLNVFINHGFVEEIQAVLNLPQLNKYLSKLESIEWSLERSWYTRSELSFLVALVNATSIVKDNLDNRTLHIIWKIAVKLVSSLPADCPSNVKKMLRAALENRKLSMEIVTNELENLNLDSEIDDIKLNLNRNVADLYERYVPLNGEWNQASMPKDWLYLPVVHIYTKCRNSDACNDDDKSVILAVLSLELILPDLVEKLSQSLRFSRLVLVYLCDTLYLSKDISALLTRAVTTLLKDNYKKLDFTVDLPGLNSFTDLFTAMCEHFCSTSYGDYGFSMTLLVPIAQRHDVHYRKLLWSEHAGLLRYIRLPLEQLVVPLNEYFYPLERDTSLIESYITALVRGTVKQNWCPIPHAIALHHSAMYLKQQSNKLALRMRNQLKRIPNKDLAGLLLNYDPPDA
ncbi:RNA polymerase II-associated protein 1 isoform X1 [Ceratina calcarata]|uniref:RNA polymerase II-associated protein 1 isoform X1 n=1 Tax=Ceratina calcarata TaxID=156304 RepID=A0AAJ7N8B3_9HYME|nr:RNA polymerase II-associated protein 1 isoform X1 [Ceratina calcarata]